MSEDLKNAMEHVTPYPWLVTLLQQLDTQIAASNEAQAERRMVLPPVTPHPAAHLCFTDGCPRPWTRQPLHRAPLARSEIFSGQSGPQAETLRKAVTSEHWPMCPSGRSGTNRGPLSCGVSHQSLSRHNEGLRDKPRMHQPLPSGNTCLGSVAARCWES